jgi:hypothetical protein
VTTQSPTGTITGPFKAFEIEQKLPVCLTITTKEGIRYALKVLSADNNGCRLEYYSLGKNAAQTQIHTMVADISRLQEEVTAVQMMLHNCTQSLTDLLDSENKQKVEFEEQVN